MLCDAAVSSQDWDLARERVEEMITMATPDLGGTETDETIKVRDVAWRSCLALGRQETYPDLMVRMALLAQAVALAPSEQVSSILPLYRAVEEEVERHPEALRAHIRGVQGEERHDEEEHKVLGSRRAARAAKLALDIGSNLPGLGFARTASPALGSEGRSSIDSTRDAASLFDQDVDVRAGARRALVKGVGWLLGTDEEQTQ